MEGYREIKHEDIKVNLIDIENEDVIKTENKSLSLEKDDLVKKINILEQEILRAEMAVTEKHDDLINLKIIPYENEDYLNLVKKVDELKDEQSKLINSN